MQRLPLPPITQCLKIALGLHLPEAESCTHKGREPYHSEYDPSPCRLATVAHAYKRQRRITSGDMPIYGSMVTLSCKGLAFGCEGGMA